METSVLRIRNGRSRPGGGEFLLDTGTRLCTTLTNPPSYLHPAALARSSFPHQHTLVCTMSPSTRQACTKQHASGKTTRSTFRGHLNPLARSGPGPYSEGT